MNKLLAGLARNVNIFIESLLNSTPKYSSFAFDFAESSASMQLKVEERKPTKETNLADLLGFDFGIVWGVPTHKTCRPTKFKKRYGIYKLWRPVENLLPCQHCGTKHEVHTICGVCYDAVRQESNAIKEVYLKTGSVAVDRESVVLYENEAMPEGEFWNGKRIVEMKKKRPDWFSADLKKRWNKLFPSDIMGPLHPKKSAIPSLNSKTGKQSSSS